MAAQYEYKYKSYTNTAKRSMTLFSDNKQVHSIKGLIAVKHVKGWALVDMGVKQSTLWVEVTARDFPAK